MVSALRLLVDKEKKDDTSLSFRFSNLKTQTDDLLQEKDSVFTVLPEEKRESALRRVVNDTSLLDEEQSDNNRFLGTARDALYDITTQPFGGLVDASESIINLALPEEREVEISDWVPEAKTGFGSFLRPASQFLIPYSGAFKVAKGGYLFLKNAGNLKKTTEAVAKAEKALKSQKIQAKVTPKEIPLKKLTRKEVTGIGVTAGALTDAIAFAPNDPNLADLFVQYPATKNVVTEWLATDPNGDPGMERLKNTLTGLIPGWVIPEIARGVAKGFSWSTKPMVRKLEKTADEVTIRESRDKLTSKVEKGGADSKKTFDELVSKRRTGTEKIAMAYRKGNLIRKSIIQYLDKVKGIDYLMQAAKGKGVKGIEGKDKIGAYKEARFMASIGGMIEHFLLKKTFKFKDGVFENTQRDGLKPLLENNLGKNADVDDFFNYMAAKSILSLDDKKFKGLFPKQTSTRKKKFQDIAKKGDSKTNYVTTLKAMDEFNSDLLDIAVDAQMITKTQKEKLLKERKHYLPLYRDLSEDELLIKRTGSNKLRAPLRAKIPVGKGEGELPFANFFDNYVENIQSIITSSYKNHVKRATFDIIDDARLQNKSLDDWAEKIKGFKLKKVTVKSEELKKQLKKEDIEIDLNQLDDIDDLALFRSERIDVGDNEYVFRTVIKNGKEKTIKDVYKVNDTLLKLSLDAVSPKNYHSTHGIVKGLQWAKNLLTRGVTYDPGFFAGANAIRDTFSAAILSRNPFHLPVLSTAMNVTRRFTNTKPIKMADGSMMSMKELYEEFILNGGSFGSTLLKSETSDRILASLYRKMGHSDYKSRVINTPKKFLDKYEDVVTGFENASRFTEYTLLRKAGVSAREAAFQAREVAVDFGMHGANNFFRQYVSTVPFLNAGLQGIYRTVRALGKGSTQRAAVITKLSTFVGTPTLMLYAINRSNPDYWNQSQQIRDTNFLVPMGDNNWLKFAKPFEFGAFGTLMESALAEFDGTAKADSFFETLWTVVKQQTRLSVVPQVVAPVLNTYMNKSFFGTQIIPDNMKSTLPDYGQSYPWSNKMITTAIENAPPVIRKRLMSPIEFEHYFRAYTGAIGGFFLDFVDETSYLFSDTKKPSKRLDELPWLKRFLQLDPTKFSRAEQEFYELRRRSQQAFNQAKKFKNELKFELLDDFLKDDENKELLQINGILESYARRVTDLNKKRNDIYKAPNMSPSRKRALLDDIEAASGELFDKIMNELEASDLEIFQPIFSPPKLFN